MNGFTNRLSELAIIQASTFAWINTHTQKKMIVYNRK